MWTAYEADGNFKICAFYSAFVRMCRHEYFFPGEAHDFWEIIYCIKGSACVSADDRVLNLTENQIIFHKPMEFHSLRVMPDTPSDLFIMSFKTEGEFMKAFEGKVFFLNPDHKRSLMDIVAFLKSGGERQKGEYLPTAYLDKMSCIPYALNTLRNITENFLISLSQSNAAPTQLVKTMETSIYAAALRIIDESVSERITVEQLSRRCNVSSAYLKKIFDKYNGLGIHEYILKNKISIAKQMLLSGEPVTEIADNLGFSNQHYFSTAFKRETGLTPSQYRKNG